MLLRKDKFRGTLINSNIKHLLELQNRIIFGGVFFLIIALKMVMVMVMVMVIVMVMAMVMVMIMIYFTYYD